MSNLGLEPTDQTNWTDTIWLTRDKTRPNVTKGDVLLATIPHTGRLGNDPTVLTPPTGYDVSVTVTLPKHISGQFYITPWSDSFDVVHKSTLPWPRPARTTLSCAPTFSTTSLANGSAANELFLRYNALPTASAYDAAYQGALQANQYAVIPSAFTMSWSTANRSRVPRRP